jgi:endonuclease/exonuclease/phosphatase (EEP) superfamily protein YafD
MSTARAPDRRPPPARRLPAAGPALLAVLAPLLALPLPEDRVWAQIGVALLLSAPPWLWAAQAALSLLLALRGRGRKHLFGLLALIGVGRPPALLPAARPLDGGLRVAVVNVNAFSPLDAAQIEAWAAGLQLDALVAVERRGAEIDGMVRVADDFEARLPRPSHHSAAWCRAGLGCAADVSPQIGSPTMQMPVVRLHLPAVGRCLVGLHAPPPVPKDPTGLRPHLEALADVIASGRLARAYGPCPAGAGVVVAGDLNHVPGSWAARLLLDRGLTDALAGAGAFGATWPGGGGFPDLPVFRLDHVLVGDAEVGGLTRLRVPGSDHRAWAFSLR